MTARAKTSCSAIIAAKSPKGQAPDRVATIAKVELTTAAITRCVTPPGACPVARTALGKTSAMKTRITAPG